MIALDTNVFARWIMRDDATQCAVADQALGEPFLITNSVLMELGWVLQSVAGMGRAEIARSLGLILRLPTANISDASTVRWAIERFSEAGDLPDLIHLASATEADSFATFDSRISRQAGSLAPLPIIDLNP